ncbi:MAG: PAS domain-containing protein, partial [Granulosicoccaceae bacterium]
MKSTVDAGSGESEAHALKDMRSFYRGCSLSFARWLQQGSSAQVIGRQDAELLPVDRAETLASGERLVLRDLIPSVVGPSAQDNRLLLRLPLVCDGQVQGLDLLLLPSESLPQALWQFYFSCDGLSADCPSKKLLWLWQDGVQVFPADGSASAVDGRRLYDELHRRLPEDARDWLGGASTPVAGCRCGQFPLSDVGRGEADVSWGLVYWSERPALVLCFDLKVSTLFAQESLAPPDFHQLLQSAPNGTLLLHKGEPVWANASAASVLGFSDPDALLQHENFLSLLPAELADSMVSADLHSEPSLQPHEGLWRTRSGGSLYLISTGKAVQWQGQACYYLSLNDISHRHRAELTQLKNQRRFQDFAELAADFFWELDTSLRFNFVSHRFENVMQIAPKNVLGLSIRQFYERYFPQPASPHWRR